MGKPTGQMQEDTQELLDHFNSHYNWEYNDMCRFIDNHTEQEFQEHYETYHRLCEDYGTELVDNFGLYFDLEASYYEKFEDCLLYTSPSPRDMPRSRMPSSA